MINTIRTIVSLFLLILCLWNIISNTYYSHSHIIEGKTIQHSHPYSKEKSHNHTGQDIVFIKIAENSIRFFLIIPIFFLLISIGYKFSYSILKIPFKYNKLIYNTNLIRAPSLLF